MSDSSQNGTVMLDGLMTRSSEIWWKAYGDDPASAAENLARRTSWQQKEDLVIGLGFSWDGYSPRDGFYAGTAVGIPQLSIPSSNMQDAGQGFRTFDPRIVGTVTSWPSGLSAAATWDPVLMRRYASAIGAEFRAKGANVVLGPGVDIARVMRGGRNSESIIGEEPFLGAAHAKAYVTGMQGEGIACVAKHFVMNTQETNRNSHNNVAQERVRWEVHYPAFQAGIEAGLASVMCSYNGVNGERSCENNLLLKGDLKERMGFAGWVMSDWWAVVDRAKALTSGLDQMMPGNNPSGNTPIWSRAELQSQPEEVEEKARRFLYGMISSQAWDVPICTPGLDSTCDAKIHVDATKQENDQLSREIVGASVVLLKNENGILPLRSGLRVALLGSACNLRQKENPDDMVWNEGDYYVVGGSGRVLSPRTVSIREALSARAQIDGSYSESIRSAMDILRSNPDVAIACGGVTSGEDDDRESLQLDQHAFLSVLASRNAQETQVPLVVLTMSTGSILTDFRHSASAVLSLFMGGQETGTGFADVLFGDVNPSGRLPVTFPMKESDGVQVCEDDTCFLDDGLYVGWRGLIDQEVAFEFGRGLSYTDFSYEWVSRPAFVDSGAGGASMRVRVRNTGGVAGREVVQLYLAFPAFAGEPALVLRGFRRTALLAPGASEEVDFELSGRDLSIWWDCEGRPYCDQRTCYGDSCYTCGQRMAWLMTRVGGSMSAEQATQQIRTEFPPQCARCEAEPGSGSGAALLAMSSKEAAWQADRSTRSAPSQQQARASAASASNDVVPAGTPAYLGCFADRTSDRDLSVHKGSGDFDYCSQQCQGFKYFGRQWEQECFCGDSYGKHGEASGCQCFAHNIGGSKNCIYEAAPPAEVEYLGCYADSVDDRAFEVFGGIGDFNFCSSACEGFDYFGRQWEQECWCGNSYDKHGPASGCTCDAYNIGGGKNCVYKFKGGPAPTPAPMPTPVPRPVPTPPPPECHDGWHRVDGAFGVFVGASSRDERLRAELQVPIAPTLTMPPK